MAEPADVTSSLTIAAPRRIKISGVVLLAIFPIWGMGEDSVYAMTGLITEARGITEQQFGIVLAIASTVGAAVTGVLLLVGNRIGRALPLGLSLCLAGVSKLLISFTTDPTVVWVC